MNNGKVKLGRDGKPAIFEDFDTGEKFIRSGNHMINVKSESFGQFAVWSVPKGDGYQLLPVGISGEIPENAEIILI